MSNVIESLNYSLVDDTAEEEMSGFNLKKISKAYDILSSIGIENNIYEAQIYKDKKAALGYFTSLLKNNSFCIIQRGFEPEDRQSGKCYYWDMHRNNNGDLFSIAEIHYGQSSTGFEYLFFYIYRICGHIKPDLYGYELLYEITTNKFEQIKYKDGKPIVTNNSNEFKEYECPELNRTIFDIIEMFNKKF